VSEPGAGPPTVAIFIPIYLGVVIPGRWLIRHQENASVRAFVKGATAAAAGAIGGATIVLARGAVVDVRTLGILFVSLIFAWRLHEQTILATTAEGELQGVVNRDEGEAFERSRAARSPRCRVRPVMLKSQSDGRRRREPITGRRG
jgi:Chromate transporter